MKRLGFRVLALIMFALMFLLSMSASVIAHQVDSADLTCTTYDAKLSGFSNTEDSNLVLKLNGVAQAPTPIALPNGDYHFSGSVPQSMANTGTVTLTIDWNNKGVPQVTVTRTVECQRVTPPPTPKPPTQPSAHIDISCTSWTITLDDFVAGADTNIMYSVNATTTNIPSFTGSTSFTGTTPAGQVVISVTWDHNGIQMTQTKTFSGPCATPTPTPVVTPNPTPTPNVCASGFVLNPNGYCYPATPRPTKTPLPHVTLPPTDSLTGHTPTQPSDQLLLVIVFLAGTSAAAYAVVRPRRLR